MRQGFAEGVLDHVGSFQFRVDAEELDVLPGDYVLVVSHDMTQFLGQIEERRLEFILERHTTRSSQALSSFIPGGSSLSQEISKMMPKSQCEGTGVVLAGLEESEDGWAAVRDPELEGHTGRVSLIRAPDEAVESFVTVAYRRGAPLLRVGSLLNIVQPVRVKLIPNELKRPTGLFGQSGSGKSYALGVIVEELILKTYANVVVLDPNGDFVRFMGKLRELKEMNDPSSKSPVTQDELAEYQQMHAEKAERIVILSADGSAPGATPIVLRPGDLDAREMAAALSLDPVRDEDEYYLLAKARVELGEGEAEEYTVEALENWIRSVRAMSAPQSRSTIERLSRRLRNLGFRSLGIWRMDSADMAPLVSFLKNEDVQAVIIDLSTLDRLERALVSSVVFRTVWAVQEERRRRDINKCTVLVLDEAHHMFPDKALFPEQELTVDWGSKIAGEGRKYGVYLLVSSQLPSKVHEHVLTQCGNVVLMKMVSKSDLDALQDSFSFVPETLLERAKWFKQGEALIIGGITPWPCLVHFEGRKTQEGGRDLDVHWGEPQRMK